MNKNRYGNDISDLGLFTWKAMDSVIIGRYEIAGNKIRFPRC